MSENKKTGITRRTFLKGTALSGALGTQLTKPAAAAQKKKRLPVVKGPDGVPLKLLINGKKKQARVATDETLADVIRDHFGLTGTKVGCDRGACGACTILVDGIPRAGCLTFAVDVEGASIETVEGIAETNGKLSALQSAFISHDAMQCGYCIPGFIVSGEALLRKDPDAGKKEIHSALSGNLCRCGSQPHIIEAILSALGKGESHES